MTIIYRHMTTIYKVHTIPIDYNNHIYMFLQFSVGKSIEKQILSETLYVFFICVYVRVKDKAPQQNLLTLQIIQPIKTFPLDEV